MVRGGGQNVFFMGYRSREQQPTTVILPGESHGQRSPVGYSPWGLKESDTTEPLTHAHTHTPQHCGSGHVSIDFSIESILSAGERGSQNNQTRKEDSFETFHGLHTGSSWCLWRCPYESPTSHHGPPVLMPPHIHALCHVSMLSLPLMDILDFNQCLLLGLVARSISTHRMECGMFELSSLALLESLWGNPPVASRLLQGECEARGTDVTRYVQEEKQQITVVLSQRGGSLAMETQTEDRLVDTVGEGGGMNREGSVETYTWPCAKETATGTCCWHGGAPPHAPWQLRGVGGAGDRGMCEREGTCVRLWLILVDVWQKPARYCEAILFQLKKTKKKW